MDALLEALQPLLTFFGDYPYMKALVLLVLTGLLAKFLTRVLIRGIWKLLSRSGKSMNEAIYRALLPPVFWTVIGVGTMAATTLLEIGAKQTLSVHSVILSIITITWSLFALRIARIVLLGISRVDRPNSLIRKQTMPLFQNLANVLIIGAGIYIIFHIWSIDMTAWLASAGIVGVAVGFAAKDTLANLFSGVFIIADSPYKIGDYVVLENGQRGKITDIGMRSTRLLTRDDVEVIIPNSVMGNTTVVNESGGPHEKFRIAVQVGVAYGSDIDQVRAVLMDIATNSDSICPDPEPRVRFRTFGASGLDFELLCWVENPELRGRVLDSLNSTVYKRFNAEGIEIPYSKHDLYIKEMPGTRDS